MGPILVKAIINFANARAAAWETGWYLPLIGKGVGMAFGLIGVLHLPSVSPHQFHGSMVVGVAAHATYIYCCVLNMLEFTTSALTKCGGGARRGAQKIMMRIPRGTLAGFVGHVGAGKSSLMQGLIGGRRQIGASRITRRLRGFTMQLWWLASRLDACGALMVFVVHVVALFAVAGISCISPAQNGLVLTYTTQLTQICNAATRQTAELENYMNSVERGGEVCHVLVLSRFFRPEFITSQLVHYSRKDLILQEVAYESDKDHKPPAHWPTRGVIEFKNVEMQYRPGLPKVLPGISMKINGEKIGVVGSFDISKIGLKDLRAKIFIIPQDAILFNGTVRTILDPFVKYND
ncbi:hypothetical protein B0H19DRAFT_1273701 [Mycena capillaripes]|nr:hypothetical protein B0H19DRAFT_1273701 [Mycena capillaripes]